MGDSEAESKRRMTESDRQRMQEEEERVLTAMPAGTKELLDLYTNRVTLNMDRFVDRIREEHEPRFKALEDGATKLEARVSDLEKKMIDASSSAASGVTATGDWKPSNILVRVCEFKDKEKHKIGLSTLRTWLDGVKQAMGPAASPMGGLKVRTTENIYKAEIPVAPDQLHNVKQQFVETMVASNLALKSATGEDLWPKVGVEQHPVRMARYRAFGSLAEVIRDKAAKTGHVITEDWLKSFSISVGKLDEEAIPVACIDSSSQVVWDSEALATLVWSREQLTMAMRKQRCRMEPAIRDLTELWAITANLRHKAAVYRGKFFKCVSQIVKKMSVIFLQEVPQWEEGFFSGWMVSSSFGEDCAIAVPGTWRDQIHRRSSGTYFSMLQCSNCGYINMHLVPGNDARANSIWEHAMHALETTCCEWERTNPRVTKWVIGGDLNLTMPADQPDLTGCWVGPPKNGHLATKIARASKFFIARGCVLINTPSSFS
ncbi:unnamed protein product [Prorocentrum cordatum]|uniref:Uncharacterized protein n=1 Tax=Prorocentrum cordatum TaxID=2364126 RepID=A0ABN9X492_9DINO|nr:unnamed protein product [Polarella glacialis]